MVAEIIVLLLWIVAGTATALAIEGTGAFIYLAPVYVIGLVGSIFVIRKVREK